MTLYGAGKCADEVYLWLKKADIPIITIIDKYKVGQFYELKIVSPEKVDEEHSDTVLIITADIAEDYARVFFKDKYKTIIGIQLFKKLTYMLPDDAGENFSYSASFPFNHYESPFMQAKDLRFWENTVQGDTLEDIDTNLERQIGFWRRMEELSDDFFDMTYKEGKARYNVGNSMFGCCDALALYRVIIDFKPNRIIEIGSGWSTCVMLDADEYRLDYDLRISCIEPFPDRLMGSIKEGDRTKMEIIEDYVQNVPLDYFDCLEQGDVLFIDSSHVVRSGGDIPYEYFRILPRLKKGVMIHIHDMFYPFTYPVDWLRQGRAYNEAYLVRALLSGGSAYRIMYFGDMLQKTGMTHESEECIDKHPELSDRGGSLWLVKES
ncbi:MAG: class I SAM-dependent methyltransferase [Lachnospiraceae bacterium]|nr:class I SAM-dependent methyltransferase [Lachnospiraceae bacterium]